MLPFDYKISFKTKLTIAFSMLITSIMVITFTVYYIETNKALHESLRSKLVSVASTGALLIDSQVHAQLKERKDEQTPAYQEIKKNLQAIKKANPQIRFVYTMVKTPQKNIWMYVVDAEENPDLISHLGDLEDVSQWDSMAKAFNGPIADETIEKDQWGYSLSGYAPIYDNTGKATAILGVDMATHNVFLETQKLKRSAALIFILALFFSIYLSKVMADHFCKPISRLVQGTKEITRGHLDYVVPLDSSIEFASLVDSFNSMVSQIKTARLRLVHQAKTDGLTNLYNHRQFQITLDAQIKNSLQSNSSFCLLFGDLDNFKVFNDLYGHLLGDRILEDVAKIIKACLRPQDTAFRYGGEEFAVILPNTDQKQGTILAETIRHEVEAYGLNSLSQNKLLMTISLGLTVFPDDASVKHELIEKSDQAMYIAKEMGRNQLRIYSQDKGSVGLFSKEEKVKKHILLNSIHALRAAVDARDHYTLKHSDSVAKLASALGKALKLPVEEIDALYQAGILHDIGKIGVSDTILQKKSQLSTEERIVIETHPVLGANILKHIPNIQPLLPLVLYHHETYDGRGYPNGLKGEDIPLGARILGIADAFHAMISDRPYRKALNFDQAIVELQQNAGSQFDPYLVNIFIFKVLEQERTAREVATA